MVRLAARLVPHDHGRRAHRALLLGLATVLVAALAGGALAHCDGMDGPVVRAAREALESGNASLVLIWVKREDEPAVREAFAKTLAVRKLGPEAKELADMYFFETVVRVHRAGEGAPYTGLKPAGRDLGPAIPAADAAIASGSMEGLRALVGAEVQEGLAAQYKRVLEKKSYRPDDLAAGREYVAAYVEFIHFVERLHEAARAPAPGHEAGHEH